ncbi:MAG: hypothetical protein O3C21_16870 [Verrucomicrobia bacterium]|nr:hypothetical protein [Verrucomicrobiota bacterium]
MTQRFPMIPRNTRLGRISGERLRVALDSEGYFQDEFAIENLVFYKQGSPADLLRVIGVSAGGKKNEMVHAKVIVCVSNHHSLNCHKFSRAVTVPILDQKFPWAKRGVLTREDALEWESYLIEHVPKIADDLEAEQGDLLIASHSEILEISKAYFQALLQFAESGITYEDHFPQHVRKLSERYTHQFTAIFQDVSDCASQETRFPHLGGQNYTAVADDLSAIV